MASTRMTTRRRRLLAKLTAATLGTAVLAGSMSIGSPAFAQSPAVVHVGDQLVGMPSTRSSTAAGDVDGDGRDEVVALLDAGDGRAALAHTTDGNGWLVSYVSDSSDGLTFDGTQLAVGDFDRDDIDDAAVLAERGSAEMSLHTFSGADGLVSPVERYRSSHANDLGFAGTKVTAGDFDGDGVDDVGLLYSYGTNRVGFLTFAAADDFGRWRSQYRSSSSNDISWHGAKIDAGDVDGDGTDDMVLLYNYGSRVGVLTFKSTDGFSRWRKPYMSSVNDGITFANAGIAVGDLDGDGVDDAVIPHRTELGTAVLAITHGLTDASLVDDTLLGGSVDGVEATAVVADLDGDGQGQIAMLNRVSTGDLLSSFDLGEPSVADGTAYTITMTLPGDDAPSEVTVVVEHGIAYHEGDVALGPIEEVLAAQSAEADDDHDGDSGVSISGQAATYNPSVTWPGGVVPYEISDSLTDSEEKLARDTIADFNKMVSSVRWRERDGEADYVRFVRETTDGACGSSEIGKVDDGAAQLLEFSRTCGKGTLFHEMLHALGAYHEHSRPDRDKHLTIVKNNIDYDLNGDGTVTTAETNRVDGNLGKRAGAITYGPYDFCSIMHYWATTWGKAAPGGGTLTTLQPKDSSKSICRGTTPTDLDVEGIDWLYAEIESDTSPSAALPAMVEYMRDGIDIDGDARADTAFIWNGRLAWRSAGGGSYRYAGDVPAGLSIDELLFGDFDGNGRTDFAWVDPDGRDFELLVRYDSVGDTRRLGAGPVDGDIKKYGARDMDGDGRTDTMFIWNGRLVWRSAGGGSYQSLGVVPAGLSIDELLFGDFDGNGKTDFAWVDPDGRHYELLVRDDSVGDTRRLGAGPVSGDPHDYRVADIDGDGRDDTVFSLWDQLLWRSQGGGSYKIASYVPRSASIGELLIGDFDGDRKAGYAWVAPDGGHFELNVRKDSTEDITRLGPGPVDGDVSKYAVAG